MFFNKEEGEVRKLVTFYSISTCAYFPLLIVILYWTDSIYNIGKYKFNSVIFLIVFAELIKYFSSSIYLKTHDVNLSKKYDDRTASSVIISFFSKSKIKDGFKNIMAVFIMIYLYFGISIIYGAELFGKYEETFMFSNLLAVLTIFPACVNLGAQSIISLVLGGKPVSKLENLFYQNFYLCVTGAWLGAFVIPLDWDRPWQVWPIPCSFGAMVGYALSHFVMLFKIKTNSRKKTKRAI